MSTFRRVSQVAILAVALLPALSFSQANDQMLAVLVPECAMREPNGPWVRKELYPNGTLRFSYLSEAPKQNPGPYDYNDKTHYVYAVFWNADKTNGDLLQFTWAPGASEPHLRIVNNAEVVSSNGKLDLQDALWGVWTHEHLMLRLAKLKVAPVRTVAVRDISQGSAVCDSYANSSINRDSRNSTKH